MKKTAPIYNIVLNLIFNPALRLRLVLICGMIMNLFYAIENLTSAIIYGSIWWGAVSLYYFLFIAIRFYLLREQRKRESENNNSVCRRVGMFLILIDLLLMLTTSFSTIFTDRHSNSKLLLLGFSVYTLYSVTASIHGIYRAKKNSSWINYAMRNMTLTAALASLYNLQYSWIHYLNLEENFRDAVSILSGVVIFSVMISLALRLIRISHGFRRFSYNKSSG